MRSRAAAITLMLTSMLSMSACQSTEVVKANSTPTKQATIELPDHLYLDVGIIPLDPNIPDQEDELEESQIIPDVRRAEAQYIAYHLKDTLEQTGNWGAVRVTPRETEAVDLIVTGKILLSDGEMLEVQMEAYDATGKRWLNKSYTDQASKFSYRGPKEDPFQDIYNRVADDLLIYREKMAMPELEEIRQVATLRYARDLAPDAFGKYLDESNGKYEINQLPADNDKMMARVDKIKDREYLFVDTLDEYYGKFYRDMKPSYDEWRFNTYEEAINLRQMKKQARNRIIGGAAMIAAGIYAGSESGTYAGQAAGVGAVGGGIGAIKSGIDRHKQAEIHEQSLRELSHSLGAEITPFILDIEGRTIELTGSADAQYDQWRTILKDIYTAETAIPES